MKKKLLTNVQPTNKSNKTIVEEHWLIPIKDLVSPSTREEMANSQVLDYNRLRAIIEENAEKLNDADGIMELLPDLHLVRETLVSNILSPKDLEEVSLNITLDKSAPPEMAEMIRQHFSSVFNLNGKLGTILGDALFTKGSYVLLSLPPTAIRGLISDGTVGLEGVNNAVRSVIDSNVALPNIGLLKNTSRNNTFALESMSVALHNKDVKANELVEISDNIGYLLLPSLRKSLNKKNVRSVMARAYGMEAYVDKAPLSDKFYRQSVIKDLPFVTLPPGDPTSETFNPIVASIPASSVIPVHVPGDPTDHVGYYVFLDEHGNFLHYETGSNKYKELNQRLNTTMENQTTMNTIGIGVTYPGATSKKSSSTEERALVLSAYYKKINDELIAAVAKGVTGDSVEISNPGELYRIMFSRQLEKQRTRVIYIPSDMITYVAFNYTADGVGESLLEKTKLYASFRAILMFATMMANIKSSVNQRTLNVVLDEADIDPTATVEQILNEFVALQANSLPLGRLNPLDIVDALQKSGIQIKVSGNKRYPATEVDIAETKRDITPPSDSVMEMLKDAHYAGLGVSRDTIDHSADIEFATTISSANLLQAKRVSRYQQIYVELLAKFIVQYISMGGPLFNELLAKYEENVNESSLSFEELLATIAVVLPKPDNAVIKKQTEDYTEYCALLEMAMDVYISEGMIKDLLVGEYINLGIDDVKMALMNMLKRQYLRAENILPELDMMLTSEDSSAADLLNSHNDAIVKTIGDVLRHIRKTEHKDDDKTKAVMDQLNPPEVTETTDDTDSVDNTSEDNLDNLGDETTGELSDAGDEITTDEGENTGELDNQADENPDNVDEEVTDDSADKEEDKPEDDEIDKI